MTIRIDWEWEDGSDGYNVASETQEDVEACVEWIKQQARRIGYSVRIWINEDEDSYEDYQP